MSSGADFETFDYVLTLGCNFGDTADMYGPFLNEELLAKAIAGRRDRIILATKFGVMHNLPQTRLCH